MLSDYDTPLLTIVTGTYNRPLSIKRCIESVIKHTTVPYELLIADADGKAALWNAAPHTLVIPDGPVPLGHTASYNRLFQRARGRWVTWLNDDAEVLPNYDTAAIHFMEFNRSIGLGALYYKEQRGGPTGPFTPFHINNYRGMLYANFGILSKHWGDKIGWFDEDFPMYGADNSLAFRTLLAGKGIAGIRAAQLIHHSEQDELRTTNQQHRNTASRLFASKYEQHMELMQRNFKRLALPEDQPPVQRRPVSPPAPPTTPV